MLNSILTLLQPALLRLAGYAALFLFGLLGALITKLGLGVYDATAETITISREAFVAGVTLMIGTGLTAILAIIRGWAGLGKKPKDQAP